MAVQCGHVYHLDWAVASKGKFLVPAYIDAKGRVRYFIINSDRSNLQQKSAENAALVFELKQADYPGFLKKDSWLCCDDIVGGPLPDEIDKAKDCQRGPLLAPLMKDVLAAVEKSRLLSPDDKAGILAQWPK